MGRRREKRRILGWSLRGENRIRAGEFKRVIKCKDGIGADWGGEWKKEYWDGNCKVKQEANFDEFKEEIKCER